MLVYDQLFVSGHDPGKLLGRGPDVLQELCEDLDRATTAEWLRIWATVSLPDVMTKKSFLAPV